MGEFVTIRVSGEEQLRRLAHDLREAGDKDLRRELHRGFNRAVKPVKAAAKQGAATTLPKSGGLAARVVGATYRTKVSSRGSGAALKLVVTGKSGIARVDHARQRIVAGRMDIYSMDRGLVRHPVYGNRHAWVGQRIRSGWFTRSTKKAAKAAQREALQVIEDVARELARKG